MTNEKLKIELYKLTDKFLVEAKDQNGNDRSLKQLNDDRHLFVGNCLTLIQAEKEQAVKEAYQSPEFTEVFEFGIEQAVREIREEFKKLYENPPENIKHPEYAQFIREYEIRVETLNKVNEIFKKFIN